MTEPTEIGLKKYADGLYEGYPCTCTDLCEHACKGFVCQCEACHTAYGDFLSME